MTRRLTVRTTFSLATLRALAGAGAPDPDGLARASAAMWLEAARARAYLAQVGDEAPASSSEPKTAKLRRVA